MLQHLLALLFVIASFTQHVSAGTGTCTGQSSLFSCDADYSDATCGACPPGNPMCSNGYGFTSGAMITGQVCGNSSLTATSGATLNKQFCCPSGRYVNETYSCMATSGTRSFGSRSYTGSYYMCQTATSNDFADAVSEGLSTIIIIVIAVAVSIGVICLCVIAWCCCGVAACCHSAAKSSTVAVMAQPATMAVYQPMQSQQVYPQPAGQVYSGTQQV